MQTIADVINKIDPCSGRIPMRVVFLMDYDGVFKRGEELRFSAIRKRYEHARTGNVFFPNFVAAGLGTLFRDADHYKAWTLPFNGVDRLHVWARNRTEAADAVHRIQQRQEVPHAHV